MILADHGYGVETALSGEEAWEIFQKTSVRYCGDGFAHGRHRRRGIDPPDSRDGFAGAHHSALGLRRLSGTDGESTGADELIIKSNKEVPELLRAVRKLAARPRRRKARLAERGTGGSQTIARRLSAIACCAGAVHSFGGYALRRVSGHSAARPRSKPTAARPRRRSPSLSFLTSDQAIAARWMKTHDAAREDRAARS